MLGGRWALDMVVLCLVGWVGLAWAWLAWGWRALLGFLHLSLAPKTVWAGLAGLGWAGLGWGVNGPVVFA